MAEGVSTATICTYFEKLFPRLWRCKSFFVSKIPLTVDLLANFLWGQKLSCNAFILLLHYNTQHGFKGLAISYACMARKGKGLGTTMRYTWGIVFMANQFPRGMRSIRSFSLTACALSSKPTFKRADSFWCPIHVGIRKLKLSKFCLGRWQIPLQRIVV